MLLTWRFIIWPYPLRSLRLVRQEWEATFLAFQVQAILDDRANLDSMSQLIC